jgi:hypothetical protein
VPVAGLQNATRAFADFLQSLDALPFQQIAREPK